MISEIEFLLDSVDQETEDSYHKYKTSLIRKQYLIFAVQLLIVHLIIFLRLVICKEDRFIYKFYWEPLAVVIASIIMLASLKWVEYKGVTYLLCILGYLPCLFYLEFFFLVDNRMIQPQTFVLQLTYILYMMISNHWLLILILNQRTKVYSLLVPLERIYLISRFYLESQSDKMVMFVKAVILLTTQIFFLYYAKQFSLKNYTNLAENEKRMHQILKLLDVASPFPVYLFHLESKLADFVAEDPSWERAALRTGQDRMLDFLRSLTIEVFHSGSIEKKKVKPAEVLSMLDSIQFQRESTYLVTRENKPIDNNLMEAETTDGSPSNTLGKILHGGDFEGHTSLDIIVTILDSALSNINEVHGMVFSLKDLNNNSILNHNEFRVFDIDLMMLVLEGQHFFTVTVKEFTTRVIVEKGVVEEQSVDIAISSIVHDMRAPLQAILGYTENLAYRIGKLQGDNQSNLLASKKIKAYCEHLDQLTNDILDSTRITNSKLVINLSVFDLRTLIDNSIDMAKTLQKLQSLDFVYNGPAKLQMRNDAHRLKRILMNLLSNSVKNTELGSITVQVDLTSKNLVRISVADTGKGISQQVQRGLFNPFKNYEDAQNIEGIGLGLATTRELVGRLGPNKQIEVTSQVGKGSVFSFEVFIDCEADKPATNYNQLASTPFIKIRDSSFKPLSKVTRNKERARSLIGNGQISPSIGFESPESAFNNQLASSPTSKAPLFRSIQKGSLKKGPILKKASLRSQEQSPQQLQILEEQDEEQELPKRDQQMRSHLDEVKLNGSSPLLSAASMQEQIPNFFILEDDLFIQDMLDTFICRFLEENIDMKEPLTIDSSASGQKALSQLSLKAADDFFYDIIFTDYNLEDEMTGHQFAQAVNQLHHDHGVPPPVVILMSGQEYSAPEGASPFKDLLPKPFSYEQLSLKLKKFMFGITSEG